MTNFLAYNGMKNYEHIIAEACRIEVEEKTGRVFIVFEVKDEKHKQAIKKDWIKDIEYRLVDKLLIAEENKD